VSTRLLVVRHGEVEGIDPERFRGRRDLPLTAKGRMQADAVAKRIAARYRPDAIYSSPLSRTIATAEAIAGLPGLPVQREADLIDIDYGDWHGLSVQEARERWANEIDLWLREPQLVQIPGGETLPGVLTRVARVLETVTRTHSEQLVILVAHESVNRVILLHALGMPLSGYWRIGQKPCCINEIEAYRGRLVVARVNDCAHLEGATDG
jgi:phosphoserine phosphatase